MKKLFTVLGIALMGVTFVGCEKKTEPERVVPAGQIARMQIWTVRESEALKALSLEFVSAVKIPGLLIDIIKFDSDEVLQNEMINQMAEGLGPDIVFTDGEWIGSNTEKLVALEQEEGFGINEYGSSFVRLAMELLIRGTDIYGVPVSIDTLAVVYNEDHLIDRLANRNQPGRTWKEFKTDTEVLTQQNNSLTRFARSGAAIGRTDNVKHGAELLENIMLQHGTPFFSEDQVQATFASTKGVNSEGRRENFGVESLKFFTSFANKNYKNFSWNELLASPDDENKEFNAFIKGDVSMVFAYPEDYETILSLIESTKSSINEKNVHVAMLPQILDPENSMSRMILGRLFACAVPRTTQFPRIAWRFLKFMSKKDTQSGFHDATGLPTARLDLILEQAAKPETGIFARQSKFARSNSVPMDKNFFYEELDTLIQKINDGGHVEKLLQSLETKITDMRSKNLTLEKMTKRDKDK